MLRTPHFAFEVYDDYLKDFYVLLVSLYVLVEVFDYLVEASDILAEICPMQNLDLSSALPLWEFRSV